MRAAFRPVLRPIPPQQLFGLQLAPPHEIAVGHAQSFECHAVDQIIPIAARRGVFAQVLQGLQPDLRRTWGMAVWPPPPPPHPIKGEFPGDASHMLRGRDPQRIPDSRSHRFWPQHSEPCTTNRRIIVGHHAQYCSCTKAGGAVHVGCWPIPASREVYPALTTSAPRPRASFPQKRDNTLTGQNDAARLANSYIERVFSRGLSPRHRLVACLLSAEHTFGSAALPR